MRRALLFPLLLILSLASCADARAQDFSGRWTYREGDETAELAIRHDPATGRVTGTFALPGMTAPVTGRVSGGVLVIERFNDRVVADEFGALGARLSGGSLILTMAQTGGVPTTLAMERTGAGPAASGASGTATGPGAAAAIAGARTPAPPSAGAGQRAGPDAFLGEWRTGSDDGTYGEALEFRRTGRGVAGSLRVMERGYFSGKTTVKQALEIEGTPGGPGLALTLTDQESGNRFPATARIRGEYLVIDIAGEETGYAREGVPLVRDASNHREAVALFQAVRGKVFVASTQASGRGAFVGKRVRMALCGDGIAYSTSDMASVPGADGGMDMGGSESRRGAWEVVLLAGAPAIHARWEGTGTSYSLDRYFRVSLGAGGRSLVVDGTALPLAGSC